MEVRIDKWFSINNYVGTMSLKPNAMEFLELVGSYQQV